MLNNHPPPRSASGPSAPRKSCRLISRISDRTLCGRLSGSWRAQARNRRIGTVFSTSELTRFCSSVPLHQAIMRGRKCRFELTEAETHLPSIPMLIY